MIDIKLRAWHKNIFLYFVIGQPFSEKDHEIYNDICVKGIEFNRFTGLKDQNGNEIYEGDIMQHPKTHKTGIVYFDNEDAKFRMGIDAYSYGGGEVYLDVIGNIHETPNILK